MRKNIPSLCVGVVVGFVLAGVAIFSAMPKMMIHENASPLGYAETVQQLETAVVDGGWVISRKMDMTKSIAKFGETIPPVTLIKICKAEYASEILNLDDSMFVSVMMLCTMAVYQKSDGKTYVSTMNTGLMGRMFGGVIAKVMGGPVAADEAQFTSFLH